MNKERLTSIFDKNRPITPMGEEEMGIMIHILMSKDPELSCDVNDLNKESETYKQLKPLIDGFQMQIFLKRLEHVAEMKISLGAFIILAQHFDSPGIAVMYAYYLFHKLPKNCFIGVNEITMTAFPFGFFSDEQLAKMWDEQKVRPDDGLDEYHCLGAHDNLLDYVEFWEKE